MRLSRCSTTPAPLHSLFGEPLHEFAAASSTRVSFMAASASGREPPKPTSACTSPSRAEGSLEQTLQQYGALCWHEPSEALRECVPGVCPWCCLECTHGDVPAALLTIALKKAELSPGDHRALFILKHLEKWIIERAGLDARGELQSLTADTEGAHRFLRPPADSFLQGFLPESCTAAGCSSGSRSTRAVLYDEFPSRELHRPTAPALSASITPECSQDMPWPPPPPPPGLQSDRSPACTQHVPASAEPLFVDIGYPDRQQEKTLKGHVISKELWESLNALAKGDRNWITKKVLPRASAPLNYNVEAVVRARWKEWRAMVERQRLEDCQAAAETGTTATG